MHVHGQGAGYAAAQGGVHDKVEGVNVGELIADHVAVDHALEVLLHLLGGDLLPEHLKILRVIGDQGHIGNIALVAGAGVCDIPEFHG